MSKFQQRHYEAIADTLRSLKEPTLGMTRTECVRHEVEWKRTVSAFGLMLRNDNDKFKPSLFLKRAGVED